jgi:hypothetical protein
VATIGTLTFSASITPGSAADAIYQLTATGACTINPPSSPADGHSVRINIIASGGSRAITFAAGIKIPSDSVFTSPQTIPSGKMYIVKMVYDATVGWCLVSYIGGYTA